MKICVNACYGEFGLSLKAIEMYLQRKGKECSSSMDIKRTDPVLIDLVEELGEELGEEANGDFAELVIVEIPNGRRYTIKSDDGCESIQVMGDLVYL